MQYQRIFSCFSVALVGACTSAAPPLVSDRGVALDSAPTRDDCNPAPSNPDACLFGEQFADIRTSTTLELTSETWISSVDPLSELEAEQVVIAVQQSSHSDVTTAGEALARVDQQEIRRIELCERATGREFVVLEYGAGDNSYGAFFARESVEVLASIHDGDLLDCSVVVTRGESATGT
jgi:hypothetical protein